MKYIISLLLLAGLGTELPATRTAWVAEYAVEETISTSTLNNLFSQAVDCCWPTTVEVLWGEYNDATLKVTQIGTTTYRLEREVDGGIAILVLEESL